MAGAMVPMHMSAGTFKPALNKRGAACYFIDNGRTRHCATLPSLLSHHRPLGVAAASSAAFGSFDQPPEKEYKPFERMRERNAYRLLGVNDDASFEEIQEARNYLYKEYKWHEPSREAIELAFERILKEKMSLRHKKGFRPPRTGRRTDIIVDETATAKVTIGQRIAKMIDPTVTLTTIINEGAVYLAMALWALFSSDQSFPLAGAFAYSVYKYQNRRQKDNPEGPHFGGNPIVGAVLTTTFNIGLACGLMTLVTAPLASIIDTSMRQVSAFLVIMVAGLLGVYIK